MTCLYDGRAASFYLPEDKQAPVIMVGPGTGIAPFRSFWQQQKFAMKPQFAMAAKPNITVVEVQCDTIEETDRAMKQWDMALFFGCRHPDLDHIYKEEVAELVQEGVLSKSICAYSRDPNQPKVYNTSRL